MTQQTPDTRIALLESVISKMEKSQGENFKKLFKILEGEGTKPGLKGCVQLQSASLSRLYKWVAGITALLFLAVEEFVRRG